MKDERKITGKKMIRACVLLSILLWFLPFGMDSAGASGGSLPIGQAMVREGAYAVRLAYALRVATTDNEIEAESRLGEIGISPAGGWIADYPVTPDILAQLQSTVMAAADNGKLIMGRNDAVKYVNDLNREFGLPDISAIAGNPPPTAPVPAPVIVNNYYASAGPPIVTYYAPPPGWFSLYAWVPYPFWCAGFRYSGYYILRDFDRVVIVRSRPVHISNHYWDPHRRVYGVHRPTPLYRSAPPHIEPRTAPHFSGQPRPADSNPRVRAPLPRVAAASAPSGPRVAAPSPRVAAPNPRVAASPAPHVEKPPRSAERVAMHRDDRHDNHAERSHEGRPDREHRR